MRFLHYIALAIVLVVITPLAAPAAAQPGAGLCFPDIPGISDCIDPAFVTYWQRNGGLPVFGYPIGPVESLSAGGEPIQTQWTERNRLELHPQNPEAYRIQLGRMGAERLTQLGRTPGAEGSQESPQPGCIWFAETGHNVCNQENNAGFKRYWEQNGLRISGLNAYQRSLALFGLPLTAAQPEPSANGELVLTQWFERARFEWHPDNPASARVLLGLLGREVRDGQAAQNQSGGDRRLLTGVEVNRGSVGQIYAQLDALPNGWVRYNGIIWGEVEPQRGERNWSALDGVAGELAAISTAGGTPLVIVRGAPAWAQEVNKLCGPIQAQALSDFATFMGELVSRYSQPPYNVKYWELGNEPDVDYRPIGGAAPYGCWGDSRQADYGGARYASMLKAAYPAIKAADPDAKVVLGGLLLDCDPTAATAENPCLSGAFLDGILAAGGGDFFDIMAYHSYTYWTPARIDFEQVVPKWQHRGGLLLGKLSLIYEILKKYGLSKPILMNEGGLLCYRSDPICGPSGFYTDQANYAARLLVRATANDLLGFVWYTLDGPGWQESGLLDAQQQSRPAYATLRFLGELLSGAEYGGTIGADKVEAYAFTKGPLRYQIYWTNDESTVEVPLPAGTQAIYTIAGERSTPTGSLQVSFVPQIVEIRN